MPSLLTPCQDRRAQRRLICAGIIQFCARTFPVFRKFYVTSIVLHPALFSPSNQGFPFPYTSSSPNTKQLPAMDPIKDVRPNPTTDLHWSSFPGSIQDIFSRNAVSYPERVCVVETPGEREGGRERRFTYGQIWRAANVLGWNLIEKGVQRSVKFLNWFWGFGFGWGG